MRIGRMIVGAGLAWSTLFAGDWPAHLGPQRNGISNESGLLSTLDQSKLKIVWKKPAGVGMSGLAVVGDTVVTLYHKQGQQTVTARSTATGEPKWETAVAPEYKNAMGDGSRATPTIHDGKVFVHTGEGILVCLELTTGKILWSTDVPKGVSGEPAEYGMASSPIVFENFVFVHAGAASATVVAVEQATGKIAWSAGKENACGYSSPTILNVAGKTQLVTFSGVNLLGIDPKTGAELWKYPFVTEYNCNVATPISIDGDILISAGENHGSARLALVDGAIKEVWTSFTDKSTLRSEWQTPILVGEYLFGFDNNGSAGPITHLTCIEAKTGKRVWQKPRFGKGNFVLADGKLWCTTMAGEIVLVKADPKEYVELGRAKVMGTTRQAPAISNGMLYVRDDQDIICIDIRQ